MFEEFTFDFLSERMLSNVNDDYDKREGSIIYDAIAPAALELAFLYTVLDMVSNEVYADTASYYYLIKRAAERGITPKEASPAIVKMNVVPTNAAVNVGDRFNIGDLNYVVTEPVENEAGAYKLQCESSGIEGNRGSGTLLPVEYVNGLQSAEISGILIPGEDEENVETFRERYFASFSDQSFGGNKADYIDAVKNIDGVGNCKVIRRWKNGYNPSTFIPNDEVKNWMLNQTAEKLGPEVYNWLQKIYTAALNKWLTVGGTVEVIIITSEYKSPTTELIKKVQDTIDPENSAGEGNGLAPIGHLVSVVGVKEENINIELDITYNDGFSFSNTKTLMEESIDSYFEKLREGWAENNNTIIRISQIETLILNVKGVLDVRNVKINGEQTNITLDDYSVPVRGDIVERNE